MKAEQSIVEALRAEKAELHRKIDMVRALTATREVASHQVDALPGALPERLWLTDVMITDSLRVTIQGVALSPLTVADLVARLDSTDVFHRASLIVAEAGTIDQTQVTRFTVRCSVGR